MTKSARTFLNENNHLDRNVNYLCDTERLNYDLYFYFSKKFQQTDIFVSDSTKNNSIFNQIRTEDNKD